MGFSKSQLQDFLIYLEMALAVIKPVTVTKGKQHVIAFVSLTCVKT
jgi:hypothetical protein